MKINPLQGRAHSDVEPVKDDSPAAWQARKYGRLTGPSGADPTMTPEFPENSENNREFFGIFGPVFDPPFVEHIKYFTIKL
jgi:hypothetical protein